MPNNVHDFLLFLRRIHILGHFLAFVMIPLVQKVRQPVVKPLYEHHVEFCKGRDVYFVFDGDSSSSYMITIGNMGVVFLTFWLKRTV